MTKMKLLDRARDTLRRKNYAYRTEQAYLSWIKRYILFHNKRHPSEMGAVEIESFLTHLAVEREISPSTQNHDLHPRAQQRGERSKKSSRQIRILGLKNTLEFLLKNNSTR